MIYVNTFEYAKSYLTYQTQALSITSQAISSSGNEKEVVHQEHVEAHLAYSLSFIMSLIGQLTQGSITASVFGYNLHIVSLAHTTQLTVTGTDLLSREVQL